MPHTLRYKGIEAWLEDTQNRSIPLYGDVTIEEESRNVFGRVNLEPKSSFTLHWRRESGLEPISAVCQVYFKDGYLSAPQHLVQFQSLPAREYCNTGFLCVSNKIMDKGNRNTQSGSTYRYLNAPYKKHGTLKAGRKCDFSINFPMPMSRISTRPISTLLRLEIRRVNGRVLPPRWITIGQDSDTLNALTMSSIGVLDLEKMDLVDDPKKGMLPYAVFIFEIPEYIEPESKKRVPVETDKANAVMASTMSASRSRNVHIEVQKSNPEKSIKKSVYVLMTKTNRKDEKSRLDKGKEKHYGSSFGSKDFASSSDLADMDVSDGSELDDKALGTIIYRPRAMFDKDKGALHVGMDEDPGPKASSSAHWEGEPERHVRNGVVEQRPLELFPKLHSITDVDEFENSVRDYSNKNAKHSLERNPHLKSVNSTSLSKDTNNGSLQTHISIGNGKRKSRDRDFEDIDIQETKREVSKFKKEGVIDEKPDLDVISTSPVDPIADYKALSQLEIELIRKVKEKIKMKKDKIRKLQYLLNSD